MAVFALGSPRTKARGGSTARQVNPVGARVPRVAASVLTLPVVQQKHNATQRPERRRDQRVLAGRQNSESVNDRP